MGPRDSPQLAPMGWPEGRALEAPDESLALLHATGLITQAPLLLVLLNLSPRAPVAFLRVWGIGRKGDEPRVASLVKQTHTQPQKNDCSKCYVYIIILIGIALQKFVFCSLHGVVLEHLGARLGLILKLISLPPTKVRLQEKS